VGGYSDSKLIGHGFIYNGSGFTTLDDPLGYATVATGISGNTIVGAYFTNPDDVEPSGFIYNGSSFTTLDDPLGVNGTEPNAIYGNTIVGVYFDSNSVSHGFVYNGSTFTTLDNPGTSSDFASGIYGNTIVGYSVSPQESWTYTSSTFTTLTGLPSGFYPNGIYGSTIVGDIGGSSQSGFVYNGSTYSVVNPPGAVFGNGLGVDIYGVYNGTLIGQYYNGDGYEGFIATPVPEPAELSFMCAAGLLLMRRRTARGA
jgi:hypothetical protein